LNASCLSASLRIIASAVPAAPEAIPAKLIIFYHLLDYLPMILKCFRAHSSAPEHQKTGIRPCDEADTDAPFLLRDIS
jgi:hypothetical protein